MRSTFGRRPLGIIEIDQEFCPLEYGVGDCRAELNDPDDRQIAPNANVSRKCFNTLGTCQDVERYLDFTRDEYGTHTKTLRFVEDISGVPESLQAIPSVISISQTPTRINPGGVDPGVSSLGERAVLTVSFKDHPYSDLQTDPYLSERDYIAIDRGTFWGKWLYRNLYRQGIPVRYRMGYIVDGQFVEDTVYYYFLQKIDGPTSDGIVTLQAFDLIKFLEASNAVFPSASPGVLSAGIDETASSFTLSPSSVGSDYPSAFRCRIGGEGFDVTRSGDVCTIVDRGLYGGLESHRDGDSVQVVAEMSGQIHDIAYDIITGAVPQLVSFIDKSQWDAIAAQFLPRVYSADITEPTGVEELLQELSESSPAYWWVDVRVNRLRLGAIRPPSEAPAILCENTAIIAGSMSKSEMPSQRVDEVWVYYFIRDAADSTTDDTNYSRRFILVNPFEQERQGRRSIKRVFSRWIGGLDAAEELAQSYISRFQETPIRFSFDLDAKAADIWVGSVIRPKTRIIQDDTGEPEIKDFQVIEARETITGSIFNYSAQSYGFFEPVDPNFIRISILPEDTQDSLGRAEKINLRALYDATVAAELPEIEFVVLGGPTAAGGSLVGGSLINNDTRSMEILDEWPWSPDITLVVEEGGCIVGRGGEGGGSSSLPGSNGETALYVRYNIDLINRGIIGGGGGGGAGDTDGFYIVGGGGGAGRQPGLGGIAFSGSGFNASITSTQFIPGTGGEYSEAFDLIAGGNGGTLGVAGGGGFNQGEPGGDAGNAIDGDTYVTYLVEGDIRGPRVN